MRRKQTLEERFIDLAQIADMPIPAFERKPSRFRSSLLRFAANALDAAEPTTAENLRLSHLLASWARDLENSVPMDETCECGNVRLNCVCDQRAAEHFLATGDSSRLMGLGWHQDVLDALELRELTPAELQTQDWQNSYQKGATPIDIRFQSMW